MIAVSPLYIYLKGGRGYWTENYTGTQSFIYTLFYSLAQKLWVLLKVVVFSLSNQLNSSIKGDSLFIIIGNVINLSLIALSLRIPALYGFIGRKADKHNL